MSETAAFERLIHEFEQQWSSAGDASLEDHLVRYKADAPTQRHALLVELICVDLEYRWKRSRERPSETKTIDGYLASFPELGPLEKVPLNLIREEYRARMLWGDAPQQETYVQRFAQRGDTLVAALLEVDRELDCETPLSGPGNKPISEDTSVLVTADAGSPPRLDYRDYLLHEMIGAGQMGKVYRATKRSTNNTVAVKFLRKSFSEDHAAVRRFLREAQTITSLRHEGIVRVHGIGETPGIGRFIVMEHLEGPDLAALLAAGPLRITDALRWTLQAARAMESVHAKGVVHCDLKPGNLVLDLEANVRVTDFGLAHSIHEDGSTLQQMAGTAPFMAPEQVSRWWGAIGPQTDVYALGAVLYCLVTGRAPHGGQTVTDVLSRVVSGIEPKDPRLLRPEVDESLAAAIRQAMAKSPQQRFASAAELVETLEAMQDRR
jgi:hypothetical protein